jgi:hypothetical protein
VKCRLGSCRLGVPPHTFFMGDADDAQKNATLSVFRDDCELGSGMRGKEPETQRYVLILMCFFHVMKNCRLRIIAYGLAVWCKIALDLTILHYLPDVAATFNDALAVMIVEWDLFLDDDGSFSQYFTSTWCGGCFQFWGASNSPIAFAATNNPSEQLNNTIKADWTMGKMLSGPDLVVVFGNLVKYYSDVGQRPFQTKDYSRQILSKRSH